MARGGAEHRIDADGPDHQAEEAGDQPLQQVVGGDGCNQREAEHDDRHHLHAAEIEAELPERRQQHHRENGGDQAAECRGREA